MISWCLTKLTYKAWKYHVLNYTKLRLPTQSEEKIIRSSTKLEKKCCCCYCKTDCVVKSRLKKPKVKIKRKKMKAIGQMLLIIYNWVRRYSPDSNEKKNLFRISKRYKQFKDIPSPRIRVSSALKRTRPPSQLGPIPTRHGSTRASWLRPWI
jgi:hypothetical protein